MFQQREVHPFQLFPTRPFGDRLNEGLERPAVSLPLVFEGWYQSPWKVTFLDVTKNNNTSRIFQPTYRLDGDSRDSRWIVAREYENRREGEKFWWLGWWNANWSWNINFYSFSLSLYLSPRLRKERIMDLSRGILWEFLCLLSFKNIRSKSIWKLINC